MGAAALEKGTTSPMAVRLRRPGDRRRLLASTRAQQSLYLEAAGTAPGWRVYRKPWPTWKSRRPTLSPQFSAMRPASDKAEFNVMAFPGSLMGNAMGGLGGGGSRSLLGMQGGDSLMGSNLQAPYHQWSADGSTAAGFGYAQQHLQQQHQHALRQQGQALGLGGEAQLGGQQVGGQEVGSQQGQAHRQRQRGGQRNKGGKSKTRPKKSNRNRNRNQDGGNSNNRGGRSGGDGGGGDGGGGGRGGRKKNTRKNKGATSAKKN